ncbi:MAG TPA: DUF4143 domain-containing protein [Leptospiraceae bacterium]|nr:DUF4143 domain-containing protein [Leptospiraceae bacterium]HMX34611.1 DUF4143 domain-containing protein [Leptospiraceae bacterium]HMY31748.1 DUF4143 domain-containing protein [Leptospiraceae bacterium]HMZ64541.1 DUF4143 domain-containing protein [Leptospiraceae bacterium]HNA06429.1 DUF4143 domain-containing protein [Leptospiraceae bacterium]
MIHLLPPYYNNLGKRLIKAPKLYFSDTGLLCSLLGVHSEADYKDSVLNGPIWEKFVFTEILKTRFFKNGYNLFYYRDQNGVEIDFLLESAKEITLVEVKKAERPSEEKLNFHKVAPLFTKWKPKCILACPVPESRILRYKEYSVWNPVNVELSK